MGKRKFNQRTTKKWTFFSGKISISAQRKKRTFFSGKKGKKERIKMKRKKQKNRSQINNILGTAKIQPATTPKNGLSLRAKLQQRTTEKSIFFSGRRKERTPLQTLVSQNIYISINNSFGKAKIQPTHGANGLTDRIKKGRSYNESR